MVEAETTTSKWDKLAEYLPSDSRLAYFQSPRGGLCHGITFFLVGIALFVTLFALNFIGVQDSSFISTSGSSWAQHCTLREPVSQIIYLTNDGYSSTYSSFKYSEALLAFYIPQGYNYGVEGFHQSLDYFAKVLLSLQANASDYTWAQQLTLISAKSWEHKDTGIKMRYTANPQYMLTLPFSGTSLVQMTIHNYTTGEWIDCGYPTVSQSGAYITVSWSDTSSACDVLGPWVNSQYAFKFDVRSAISAYANNIKLINYTTDLESSVGVTGLGTEFSVYYEPHYEGMQSLECYDSGYCYLSAYQNSWELLEPYFYHYCDVFSCPVSCSCNPKDVSHEYCAFTDFVLRLYTFGDYYFTFWFYSDFSFPMNEHAYRYEYPNCSSAQLVPSKMLEAVQTKSIDTGVIETFYTCTHSVGYSFLYSASTSFSLLSGGLAACLMIASCFLKRSGATLTRKDLEMWNTKEFISKNNAQKDTMSEVLKIVDMKADDAPIRRPTLDSSSA